MKDEKVYAYDVFISYRWITPDQEWVREQLYSALVNSGLKVCLDVEDFVPGRDLILEMERAGLESRHVLCVISPEYFEEGRMVEFESLSARRRDPAGRNSFLIPLILRDAKIPERVRGLIPISWTNPNDHTREWRKLLRVLGAANPDVPQPGAIQPREEPTSDGHRQNNETAQRLREQSEVEHATNAQERRDISFLVRPKLDRILGWCALATLVIGYIATTLGRFSEFYLFELVGPNRLLSIHFGMKFAVAALFIVGYFTLAVWVYRRYLRQVENLKRRLWGAGAVTACGLLLAGGSIFAAIPPKPNVLAFLDKETSLWDRVLLDLHVKGGGLKTSKFDPSAEPQVWSTAQALTGILVNGPTGLTKTDGEQIREHLEYIENARLPKEEGWGYFQQMEWGVTEIAGWVVLAYLASTQPNTVGLVWGNNSEIAFRRLASYLELLKSRQLTNGGWAPISQKDNEKFARTYSTTMALWALIEAKKHPEMGRRIGTDYNDAIKRGIQWLLEKYGKEVNSWVPNPERPRQTETFTGLTAQVLYVLERARPEFNSQLQVDPSYERALQQFKRSIVGDKTDSAVSLMSRPASRNDRMSDGDNYLRPSKFMLEGSTFLWFPWSLALCSQLTRVPADTETTRDCNLLLGRVNDLSSFVKQEQATYIMAESLFAIQLQIESMINRQLTTPKGTS
jgi:TIR domain